MGWLRTNVKTQPHRQTVDLSAYPDLVVIYLGMRANFLRGLKTLIGFGRKIKQAVADAPAGLLLHENIMFSVFPPHAGMRQYWRDFSSLEQWARSGSHAEWWRGFLRDRGGAGFWHETYSRRGEIETVYIDMPPLGLGSIAALEPARGSMFSARRRLGVTEEATVGSVLSEDELYDS